MKTRIIELAVTGLITDRYLSDYYDNDKVACNMKLKECINDKTLRKEAKESLEVAENQ